LSALIESQDEIDIKPACQQLELSRATLYRRIKPPAEKYGPPKPRPKAARSLSPDEQEEVLGLLHSDRFVDQAPAQLVAKLLEEGEYFCSERTMYRVLAANGEVKERRNQRKHPSYARPELLAKAPNQVWSWDVTKLKGAAKGQYFSLYVIIDIFSRYIVGWFLSKRATAEISCHLISETLKKYELDPQALTVHSDRGSEFIGSPVGTLFEKLGVTKSKSRPKVSNDNPYSESSFKTLKYHHTFPERFGCLEDAKSFLRAFFNWYNGDHHHSGIALLTPATVHFGRVEETLKKKQRALDEGYKKHPERWVHGPPKVKSPLKEVWINGPTEAKELTNTVSAFSNN
jgi:putative transposase